MDTCKEEVGRILVDCEKSVIEVDMLRNERVSLTHDVAEWKGRYDKLVEEAIGQGIQVDV